MAATYRPLGMSRARKITTATLIVFFVLLLSSSGLARLFTDYLWFDRLGLSSVWTTLLTTKLWLATVFSAIFAVLLWLNLWVASRYAPDIRPMSPEDELLERYHAIVGDNSGRVRIVASAIFGLLLGISTAGQWNQWLLFRNSRDFGMADPVFGKDASFYVFRLPFWNFLANWTFTALIFTIVFTVAAHYLYGGIRASAMTNRVSEGAKVQLSILMALLAVVRAVMYYLDRFDLLTRTGGVVDGALTTDLTVRLPTLNLLVAISLCAAVLFIANIWRHGWSLPALAIGLWLVVSIVAGTIFPSAYQRIRVQPDRTTREAPFVERNIEATLFAYGLDDSRVSVRDYQYEEGFTSTMLAENQDIFDSVALLDPTLVQEQYTKTQSEKVFYGFSRVLEFDRYQVDDTLTPLLIATRDLIPSELEDEWEIQHIVFTHGYGVVAAGANDVTTAGAPNYLVSESGPEIKIDPAIDLELDTPQIYFSEGFNGYAIVGATRDEVDFQSTTSGSSRYDGDGGIAISSVLRKAAFALRFGDFNILISDFLTDESEIIFQRNVVERVRQVAPYLGFDEDPYPIVDDGRVKWVVEAFTSTSRFPYSEMQGSADTGEFNYIRNSVKAVVDSYDGSIELYVTDTEDPIIKAYQSAFPDLYTPVSEAPANIAAHFRYSEFLFDVQTSLYATYQVGEPVSLIQRGQSWVVSNQPQVTSEKIQTGPMEPQYMVTRLPGESESEFVIQRSFVPGKEGTSADNARPELTAMMYGRSDPGHYGELVVYRLQSSNTISAPDLVDSDIRKDGVISSYITLRDDNGSTVQFGNMVTLLVDGTIVYVRPLYIEADGGSAVPELERVIAVSGSSIAMAETLDEALVAIATGRAPTIDNDPGDSSAEPDPSDSTDLGDLSVSELLRRASTALDAADAIDAANGSAEEAAALRAEAAEAILRVEELLGVPEGSTDQESGEG